MAGIVVLAAAAACALLAASVSSAPPVPVVFSVGDARGWAVPADNATESYNHWAKRNRFLVGDVLHFKYANDDSVLVVGHDGYKECSTARPESRFTGGDTKFTFGRSGLFFFISGAPGHCEAGQRMIVRVMAQSPAPAPAPAPIPAAPMPMPGPAAAPAGGAPSSASSSSPSPQAQASGASTRMLAGVGFSIVVGLFVCVVSGVALA